MVFQKRAQISTEYLIIVAFVTFVILVVFGVSLFYFSRMQDQIKFSQIDRFANKVVLSAESVYYSGEPSRMTITGYLPEGVARIDVLDREIIFSVLTSSGETKISYSSNVRMEGSIDSSPGVKKINVIAGRDKVQIQNS